MTDTVEQITVENVEQYRGGLTIRVGDLAFPLWTVFDQAAFGQLAVKEIVPLSQIVSTKNQLKDPKFLSGLKQDPRQTAFERMSEAGRGTIAPRAAIRAARCGDLFTVRDGNATVQVLMLVGWTEVPVEIVE